MAEQVTLIYKRKGEDKPLQTWVIELDWREGMLSNHLVNWLNKFSPIKFTPPPVQYYRLPQNSRLMMRGKADPLPQCFFTHDDDHEVRVMKDEADFRCSVEAVTRTDDPTSESNTRIQLIIEPQPTLSPLPPCQVEYYCWRCDVLPRAVDFIYDG